MEKETFGYVIAGAFAVAAYAGLLLVVVMDAAKSARRTALATERMLALAEWIAKQRGGSGR